MSVGVFFFFFLALFPMTESIPVAYLQGSKSAMLHWHCTVVLRDVERAFRCFLLVLDLCSKKTGAGNVLLCSSLCTHVLSIHDGPHFETTLSCASKRQRWACWRPFFCFVGDCNALCVARLAIVGANHEELAPLYCCAYLWETYRKRLQFSEHLFPFMHQFHSLLSSRSNM